MFDVKWDTFSIKNKNKEDAFETMCRHLFFRKFSIDGYGFQSNYNQTGLETQPIKFNNEWYGFQCKFSSSNNNDALYKEVYTSLNKAYKCFPNSINHIYIYTNADIQPICTDDEIKNAKKISNRMNIQIEAKKYNVELHWIKTENFNSILNEHSNLDIYKLYFSSQNELAFLDDSISLQDRTFLNSSTFLDLHINGKSFNGTIDEIFKNKVSLIIGNAGTGKTELLKKLYVYSSDRFLDTYKNVSVDIGVLPIFLRLRECVHGDVEGLLKQRLIDYKINIIDCTYELIYFFDGLDEISNADIDKVISFVNYLSQKRNTRSVLISSRKSTPNLQYLHTLIEVAHYEIDKLNIDFIDLYFSNRNDGTKLDFYQSIKSEVEYLLSEIDDIFSVNLLWQTIESLDANTTKIELIQNYVNKLMYTSHSIKLLPLPEIKSDKIEDICSEVAFFMQETNRLNIDLSELQNISFELFKKLSYTDIDKVILCISGMFFDITNKKSQRIYSFKHRRYQEYFLYKKISSLFFENPFIIRELGLLPNKDFVLRIFLKQSLKDALSKGEMIKVLSLRFFEAYLGSDYWYDYKDSLIGVRSDYGVGDESYLSSNEILITLAIRPLEELCLLLENEAFSLKNFLSEDNYWNFVKEYYRFNKCDVRQTLLKYYKLDSDVIKKSINKAPCEYWYCVCQLDKYDPKDILEDTIKKLQFDKLNFDFIAFSKENLSIASGYFKMLLDINYNLIPDIIDMISVELLEIFSFDILRNGNIRYLFDESPLNKSIHEKLILRIDTNPDVDYQVNTLALYAILSKKIIRQELLEARFSKVNKNHHITWEQNIELNCHIVNLLGVDQNLYSIDCLLGCEIRKIVLELYPQNKDKVLDSIIDAVKKYNLLYENWFLVDNSKLIGAIVAQLSFNDNLLKEFVSKLYNYQSVISLTIVLEYILVNNQELFLLLVNENLLKKLNIEAIKQLGYYEYNSDTDFIFSTMFSKINKAESYKCLIRGINNSIYRPAFRKEDVVDSVLPECLLLSSQNHWYSEIELESMSYRIYSLLKIMTETTDKGSCMAYFKYVLEACLPQSSILDDLYDEAPYNPLPKNNIKENTRNCDFKQIDKESITDYYECKISEAPYYNLGFWKELISIEKAFDDDLHSLFSVLQENHYPEPYGGKINEYFPIITAALLSDTHLSDISTRFILKQGGRSGLINMIKSFSLMGDSENASLYINQIFKLTEALVFQNETIYNSQQYKYSISSETLDLVFNSKKDDWITHESEQKKTHKNNPRVKIIKDDIGELEGFHEKWAIEHINPEAYKVNIGIYHDDNLLMTLILIYVDGYRALLPIPMNGSSVIQRKMYNFALLFNDEKTLNSYIRASKLLVD